MAEQSVLTIPNWSFGRNRFLRDRFQEILADPRLTVHYLQGDIDHNRTVTAFSGPFSAVEDALFDLATSAFEAIDLNHHLGVHPRIGALDVCPFLPIWNNDDVAPDWSALENDLIQRVNEFGAKFADQFEVPIFLYEKSATKGKVAALPQLRKEGFGGLLSHNVDSDFGPDQVHERLGATVIGVRDFLIAMNCNIDDEYPAHAKDMASRLRELRKRGDERFTGVRSLGFALASRGISQLSMNLTVPNRTPIDPIIQWVQGQCNAKSVAFAGSELIGVIRPRDMEHGTLIYPQSSQIVEGVR